MLICWLGSMGNLPWVCGKGSFLPTELEKLHFLDDWQCESAPSIAECIHVGYLNPGNLSTKYSQIRNNCVTPSLRPATSIDFC